MQVGEQPVPLLLLVATAVIRKREETRGFRRSQRAVQERGKAEPHLMLAASSLRAIAGISIMRACSTTSARRSKSSLNSGRVIRSHGMPVCRMTASCSAGGISENRSLKSSTSCFRSHCRSLSVLENATRRM